MTTYPDREGFWYYVPDDLVVEVYPLTPVGGTLCVWGPEVGNKYTGAADTQGCWETDEWQGHIPVRMFDDIGPWKYIGPNHV